MVPKVLGKKYLVVFCKHCESGFRVREEPLAEGAKVAIREPETHKCPGCGRTAKYEPQEMRVATYQKEGLGRRKNRQSS